MSEGLDPERWLDDASVDASLREDIRRAGHARPSATSEARIRESLGLPIRGPDGTPSPTTSSPPTSIWTWAAAAAALLGLGIGGAWVVGTLAADDPVKPRPQPPSPTTIDTAVRRESPPEARGSVQVGGASAGPPAQSAANEAWRAASAPRDDAERAPRPAPVPSALELLESARRSMDRPRTALRYLERHRRWHRDGVFSEEREVLAVQALAADGAIRRARVRARRFYQRWPQSAHRRRVEELVRQPSPSPALTPQNTTSDREAQ